MVLHSTLYCSIYGTLLAHAQCKWRKNGRTDCYVKTNFFGSMGYQNLTRYEAALLALRGCRMHLNAYPNNLSWNSLIGWSRQVLRILLTSLPGIFPESSPVWLLLKAHNFWNFFSLCLQFIEVIQHWHATGTSSNHTNGLKFRHLRFSILFLPEICDRLRYKASRKWRELAQESNVFYEQLTTQQILEEAVFFILGTVQIQGKTNKFALSYSTWKCLLHAQIYFWKQR